MKSLAVACALLSVVPTMALAQARDSDRHTYCQVEDSGNRDIWVSQVFPTPPGDDFLGTAMATEFHRHVGTLGGAGNKNCITAVSRAAAEESRAKIAAIMGKRSFGIRVYDWHDVNWTPSPAAYANPPPPTNVAAPIAAAAPAASTSVAPVATAPTQAAGRGVNQQVARQLSSATFFKIPDGKGESLHRSGSHIANQNVPLSMDTTTRRVANSNQCQQEQTILAGEGGMIKNASTGLTWAGIIPLDLGASMASRYGATNSELKATSIDKLVGQPFPLVAGNKFGWTVNFDNTDTAKGAVTQFGQDWSCTVGATAAASSTIAGLPGEQTELQCRVDFVSLAIPPQNPVFFWYSAGGCFIQDPTR